MKKTQCSSIVGVFEDHLQADRAIEELRRVGFRNDQIGVAIRDPNTGKISETGSHALAGAATGAAAGAGLGGLVGLGILTGLIPGIGPAIAAGTLGVILANAAGGAAIGGLAGSLIGLGIPEDEAQHYEGEFKAGRTIVTVKDVTSRFDEAWAILRRHGAYNKEMPKVTTGDTSVQACQPAGSQSSSCSTAATQKAGRQTMRLHEEQLHVHKQPVQTGEVRVHKEVVTEHKTIDVPVSREEVVVERHAVNKSASGSRDIGSKEEIRVPVTEEQVRVSKEAVVKEEVSVGKRQVQDTQKVGGTVRKEQVKVEQQGNVSVASTEPGKKDLRP